MAQNYIEGVLESRCLSPADPPVGMAAYNLNDLSGEQKKEIAKFKLKKLRDDHMYLRTHPEIRKVISFLFNAVMKRKPIDVAQFLCNFVSQNISQLAEIILGPEGIRVTPKPKPEEPKPKLPEVYTSYKVPSIHLIPCNMDIPGESFRLSEMRESKPRRLHMLSESQLQQEATLVSQTIMNELLNKVCKDDVILQFTKCFRGSKQSTNYGMGSQASLESKEDFDF